MDKELLEMLESIRSEQRKTLERVEQMQDDIGLLRAEQKEDKWTSMKVQQDTSATRDAVKIIKEDLRDIKRKVDVLYDWVDSIDLKVKDIDDRTVG